MYKEGEKKKKNRLNGNKLPGQIYTLRNGTRDKEDFVSIRDNFNDCMALTQKTSSNTICILQDNSMTRHSFLFF